MELPVAAAASGGSAKIPPTYKADITKDYAALMKERRAEVDRMMEERLAELNGPGRSRVAEEETERLMLMLRRVQRECRRAILAEKLVLQSTGDQQASLANSEMAEPDDRAKFDVPPSSSPSKRRKLSDAA